VRNGIWRIPWNLSGGLSIIEKRPPRRSRRRPGEVDRTFLPPEGAKKELSMTRVNNHEVALGRLDASLLIFADVPSRSLPRRRTLARVGQGHRSRGKTCTLPIVAFFLAR